MPNYTPDCTIWPRFRIVFKAWYSYSKPYLAICWMKSNIGLFFYLNTNKINHALAYYFRCAYLLCWAKVFQEPNLPGSPEFSLTFRNINERFSWVAISWNRKKKCESKYLYPKWNSVNKTHAQHYFSLWKLFKQINFALSTIKSEGNFSTVVILIL